MNDSNPFWDRFNADFSTRLLGVQRAETQAIEAEAARVRSEAERVMQDKPQGRRGDRNV